jgi:hypothetical protein
MAINTNQLITNLTSWMRGIENRVGKLEKAKGKKLGVKRNPKPATKKVVKRSSSSRSKKALKNTVSGNI